MPKNKDLDDLEQVRAILIGPFEEHLKQRDEKILDVLGQMQTAVFARVEKLEEIVAHLSESLDQDRNRTVTEIGDAMAQLGQQLRTFGFDPSENMGKNENPASENIDQAADSEPELVAQATG